MAQSTITRFYKSRKYGKVPEDLKLIKNLTRETQAKNLSEITASIGQSPEENSIAAEETTPSKSRSNLVVQDDNSKERNRPVRKKLELNKPGSEPKSDLKIRSPILTRRTKPKIGSKRTEVKGTIGQSPERNSIAVEETTPSKSQPSLVVREESSKERKRPVRQKLELNKPGNKPKSDLKISPNSKNQLASPRKLMSVSEKQENIINQSRSSLSEKALELERFQSRSCKIASVASSSAKKVEETSPIKRPPVKPVNGSLIKSAPEKFILPEKFKILCEMFQSMDNAVSILNNRKEKITFEKVKQGVQKKMKRNFTKQHLGQIIKVYPSAYTLELKKPTRKIEGVVHELIVCPNLTKDEDGNYIANPNTFVSMDSQTLLHRKQEFHNNVLNVVKKHHQEFLNSIKQSDSSDRINDWHTQFDLDSVPDILPAELPQPPESKAYTAKNVLSEVKRCLESKNKLERATQKVAEESENEEKNDGIILTPGNKNPVLKGISPGLIEKIRAKDAANLQEAIARDPVEEKRKAMLERLPKIIDILWHCFIAERKASFPVDVAVDRIIHSLNTLSAPADVEDHLKLIAETFPGWLQFVKVSKGTYITIDKKKNIYDMLANFTC